MTTLTLPEPRIALIGECMIELQQHADGSLQQSFGGDTLNTAVYLCRELAGLGSVDYVTALGDDSFSDAMCRVWASPHRAPRRFWRRSRTTTCCISAVSPWRCSVNAAGRN